jgi:hypothetical protein
MFQRRDPYPRSDFETEDEYQAHINRWKCCLGGAGDGGGGANTMRSHETILFVAALKDQAVSGRASRDSDEYVSYLNTAYRQLTWGQLIEYLQYILEQSMWTEAPSIRGIKEKAEGETEAETSARIKENIVKMDEHIEVIFQYFTVDTSPQGWMEDYNDEIDFDIGQTPTASVPSKFTSEQKKKMIADLQEIVASQAEVGEIPEGSLLDYSNYLMEIFKTVQ